MKHFFYTLLFASLLLPVATMAQTPYDSFAPETSRPMLETDALYEEIVKENRQTDTILCAAVIDLQTQSLYLVSLADGTLLASAPLTDDLRKWLSVDPLVDKNIATAPYMYCLGNPMVYIDPNGEDEWTLDTNTGQFHNIGDKGGSTTDYYSVGTYEGKNFTSYADYEIERGEGTINSFRIKETDKSTISAFHIPETNTEGFFLERPGPDTEESEQFLRIPAAQYGLHKNSGSRFPGVPRLYLLKTDNNNEGVGGAFDKRAILIHAGNTPDDTAGCLLPGSTMSTDFVGGSRATLKKITDYITSKNWNCMLNIFNAFK